MCVNTMVFTSPMRPASQAATGKEKADSAPDQKKNNPASASERPKRSNSQRASSDCTASPPAKESTLKSAARRRTMPRDGPSGA